MHPLGKVTLSWGHTRQTRDGNWFPTGFGIGPGGGCENRSTPAGTGFAAALQRIQPLAFRLQPSPAATCQPPAWAFCACVKQTNCLLPILSAPSFHPIGVPARSCPSIPRWVREPGMLCERRSVFLIRCAPAFAPVVLFPVTALLPSSSTVAEWRAVDGCPANQPAGNPPSHPGGGKPKLLSWLAGKDTILVGSQTPPADLSLRWAATVRADPPAATTSRPACGLIHRRCWNRAPVPITLADVNPELFSPGKLEVDANRDPDAGGW